MKSRRVSPQRPDPAAEGHPVNSGDTTDIIVKHAVSRNFIVRTDDPRALRKVAGGNLRMLNQKGASIQPVECAPPLDGGERIRVKGHIRDLDLPLPKERAQGFECRVGFEGCVLVLVHCKIPLWVMETGFIKHDEAGGALL